MSKNCPINFGHAANQAILAHRSLLNTEDLDCQPALKTYTASELQRFGRDDLIEYFWFRITKRLPENCGWSVNNRAFLVHPTSGVIFASGGGTSTIVLRLPDSTRQDVYELGGDQQTYPNGSTEYASEYGDDWAFVPSRVELKTVQAWCLEGYQYAASL